MPNNFVKNSFWIAIAFFCATHMSYTQSVDATIQNPFTAGSALINIGPNADGNLTLGGEYKQPKQVIEQQKPVFWTWYVDAGYESEYNFRGTDLMPNSDGGVFLNAQVTKWNFTLGMFVIHQLGTASVNSWSIGEGGGSGFTGFGEAHNVVTGAPIPTTRFPQTTQNRFNEIDVFLSYKFSLGPVDVTIGNIGFFIDRKATTFETDVLPPPFIWVYTGTGVRKEGPDPTVEDEQFDRIYIRLSTTKLSKYITPQITYYQTLLSDGSQPTHDGTIFYPQGAVPNTINPPPPTFIPNNPRPFNERNTALGGYLEGRINGHVPITKWADFNPHAIISVSFRDRTEPGGSNPYGGHPLTGWNHVQAGAEIPIHLVHLGGFSSVQWAPPDADLYFVPFGDYAYHISNPPIGTNRNEWWGGGKFEVTF